MKKRKNRVIWIIDRFGEERRGNAERESLDGRIVCRIKGRPKGYACGRGENVMGDRKVHPQHYFASRTRRFGQKGEAQRRKEGTMMEEIDRKSTARSSLCPCRYSTGPGDPVFSPIIPQTGRASLPRDLDPCILFRVSCRTQRELGPREIPFRGQWSRDRKRRKN